jgi:hypothetical protein
MSIRTVLLALVVAAFAGCGRSGTASRLGGIYNEAARHHDAYRNPVIVIPGILGSKLVDPASGRVVWGAFSGDYADPSTPDGARLVAVPMIEGVPVEALDDGIVSDGALDRVRVDVLFLPIEVDAYARVLGTLGAIGGYRDEAIDYGADHFTCFQFGYDWRRDLAFNARRLAAFIEEKAAFVREQRMRRFGNSGPVRFDIVAHSMGSLLARYYLRYGAADLPADGSPPPVSWAGAERLGRVVLIGPPNAGSAAAVEELVEGVRFSRVLPRYGPAVIGTMPAVYQLLPRPRHGAVLDRRGDAVDVYDVATWERNGWGLLDPDEAEQLAMLLPDEPDAAARRRIAVDHVRKCLERAERVAAALDAPATDPPVDLLLFAGDAILTAAVLTVADDGALSVTEAWPGDGTVTRASALLDERTGSPWRPYVDSPIGWSRVTFLFTDHLGMTEDPAFVDNVLYELLEAPRD